MKKILLSLILWAFCIKLFAQDPSFSQTYANPLYLNPAYAGTDSVQRVCLNFRYQWPNIQGDFITYNASYDRMIIPNLSVGVIANQDITGQNTLTTTTASLIVAYQLHIKSFTLSAAFQGAYRQLNLNTSNLYFGDDINPRRGFIYNTQESPVARTMVANPDFTAGILGYGKYYFAGFAIDHLTQPDESFVEGTSVLPMKFIINAGGIIPVSGFTIYPTFLCQLQQNFNTEVAEVYLNKWHFTIGLGYRFGDAMIFALGFQSKYVRIGYSYDYTTSSLTNQITGGSHEVSAAVLIPYKSEKFKKYPALKIPNF
jgi:type IX secretion system PorP/SprF family membrane protein